MTFACLASFVLTIVGCNIKSTQEQVAAARAQYTVTLNDVTAAEELEPELENEAGLAESAAEAAEIASATEEAAAEGEETDEGAMGMEDEGPQSTNVLFDILVSFQGKNPLDGITVDVTHVDEDEEEKGVYLQFVDTAGMLDGETRQVDFELEGVAVEDGDAFSVTLASGVPANAGDYREFSQASP
ncbi:MAG: hypothetical protein HKN43_06945 [Rhodothermales bacterium]|nr:hypothetical protein [Rhodothermales bacterium]